MRKFLANKAGSLSVYTAIFSAFAIGTGAVAVDYGRSALLRSQMQDAADSAAMAAVIHLDGKNGAQSRAEQIATFAVTNRSNLPSDGAGTPLAIGSVKFYSQYTPTKIDATNDLDAKVIEVTMSTKTINYMFAPVLNLLTGGSNTQKTLTARSVAGSNPFICHAPPLMMCDLTELDPLQDPTLTSNIGRQVRLKEPQSGGGTWVPGNFGLLSLPDGSTGASQIEGALAAVEPADCYQLDVITATGSKTNKVKQGINARFDISTMPDPPAPNVINYPLDDTLIADENLKLGDGIWDIDAYWLARHGTTPPADLANASRYQAYLFELGEAYARNALQTLYPAPATLPSGFTLITPAMPNIPVDATNPTLPDFDGVPQNTPASNGPARRLVKVALLQCVADGINGYGTYPTHGKFVEMFITQEVRDPPNAAIYGEIVRSLSPLNEPEFHANARLVE
jgi:Flp pilus assembly protein TadG